MFIRATSGKLVNLNMVGEIYIQNWDFKQDQDVVAETRTSNHESSAVYTVLFSGTEAECNAYIDRLWAKLPATITIK